MLETLYKATSVISSVLALIVVVVIKFNDMKHLEKGVDNIEKKIGNIENRQINHESRISKIEGWKNGNK